MFQDEGLPKMDDPNLLSEIGAKVAFAAFFATVVFAFWKMMEG